MARSVAYELLNLSFLSGKEIKKLINVLRGIYCCMMFCGNTKQALRSLDFLDASLRSHTVLGLLSAPGLSALEGGRAILPLGHRRTQNTAQTSAPSPDLSYPGKLRPKVSNPTAPGGRCPFPPAGLSTCIPLAAGWERLGLSSLLPGRSSGSPRPGAAGSVQPGTASLDSRGQRASAGPERIHPRGPELWGSRSRPGTSLASWPNSPRCPRAGPGCPQGEPTGAACGDTGDPLGPQLPFPRHTQLWGHT